MDNKEKIQIQPRGAKGGEKEYNSYIFVRLSK